MITFTNVRAGSTATEIRMVNLAFAPGKTALFGHGPERTTLLECLASETKPRLGKITGLPQSFVYVAPDPPFPSRLSVRAVWDLANQLRGTNRTLETLERFGLGQLLAQEAHQLGIRERRTLAIVEALTSNAAWVFLDEPLLQVLPEALGVIHESIQTDTAHSIVFSTRSSDFARSVAGRVVVLFQGSVLADMASSDPRLSETPGRASVEISSNNVRLLAPHFAPDLVVSIQGDTATLTGSSVALLEEAVERAVLASGVAITALRRVNVEPEWIRATFDGALRAAYDAGQRAGFLSTQMSPLADATEPLLPDAPDTTPILGSSS